MRGQVDYTKQFLRQGADPDYVRGGHSILMRLARGGRADIAEILIESGANVNYKGRDGASALTLAAEHGNTGVARMLLAHGADADIRLLLAARADVTPRDRDGETALMTARRRGHGAIARMLKEAGARE
jgi:cytohesin